MNQSATDFTESSYRELVSAAGKRFRFQRFGENSTGSEAVALWRHDIDFSPQRALALARIEADHGLRATYFVQLSSRFYSVLEPETARTLRAIIDLGHDLGLHFDTEVCHHLEEPDYPSRLKFEVGVLEELAGVKVSSFTLHNPTTITGVSIDEPTYAGYINGSASVLRQHYVYCSDSNGLWRYRSLHDLVADESVTKLYALTHPEWWQESAMPPRARLQRSIEGRAAFCREYYDNLLAAHNRPNVLTSDE